MGLKLVAPGRREDQKRDDIYHVKQKTRFLAHISMKARVNKPGITLANLLVTYNFDLLVDIAKQMSTHKEKPSMNVGRAIGLLLQNECQ